MIEELYKEYLIETFGPSEVGYTIHNHITPDGIMEFAYFEQIPNQIVVIKEVTRDEFLIWQRDRNIDSIVDG